MWRWVEEVCGSGEGVEARRVDAMDRWSLIECGMVRVVGEADLFAE